MKWLMTLFFCGVFCNLLFSQNKDVLLERLQKEEQIVLLNNEYDIIPVQRLDTLDIGVVIYGDDSLNFFENRIKSYTQPTVYRCNPKNFYEMRTQWQGHDLLIVAYSRSESYKSAIDYFSHLIGRRYIIQVSFAGSSIITDYQGISHADGLILTPDDGPITQDYTAQLIFGGIAARGKLKSSLNLFYEAGAGKETSVSRLKYTIPEEIGIDSEHLKSKVDAIMAKGLSANAFPGAQLLAVKDGKVFFHETYGFHEYDSLSSERRAVRKDDIYDLASVTKVTGATLSLMKLHDQGSFQLDLPAYTYWPDFKKGKKKGITFRQILAHQARLKSWIPYWTTTAKKNGRYKKKTLSKTRSEDYPYALNDSLFMHKDYQKKIYQMIRKSPLNDKEGYVYSGLSFYLYPEIVKRISGEPFDQFLLKQFYAPLGAGTVTFNAGDKFPLERIIPTEVDTFFRMKKLHGVVHDEGAAMMKGISGNAGLFANAEDLAKVWQMLLNDGAYGSQQFLSPQVINKFTGCQYCEEGNRRGLGFDKPLITYHPTKSSVSKDASSRSYGHSGYTGTFVWADPENDFLFIFLSNRVHPTRNNRKIYELNIRPDLHDVFYQSFK